MGTTKAQIDIDYNVNQSIRNDVDKKRKFDKQHITKERHIGIMVENYVKLEKALKKSGGSIDQLLISLNAK